MKHSRRDAVMTLPMSTILELCQAQLNPIRITHTWVGAMDHAPSHATHRRALATEVQ